MINLDSLKYISTDREKKAFYASDFGRSNLELYLAFIGEEITNPPKWYDTLKWAAGKGVEEAMLEILKSNGQVKKDYNQKEHGRIELEYKGIKVHGYIDAIHVDEYPIEIKSINNANKFDVNKYSNGYPRENYVGQLGIYMHSLGQEKGVLFVSSIDGLNRYEFEAKITNGVVRCGNIEVNINKELDRWARLYKNNIVPKVMPDPFEIRYKYDIEKLDWKEVSRNEIGKARNGHKVLGDWQVSYSPYKDKIIALQGETIGYSDKELARIKELTDGFTTWKK